MELHCSRKVRSILIGICVGIFVDFFGLFLTPRNVYISLILSALTLPGHISYEATVAIGTSSSTALAIALVITVIFYACLAYGISIYAKGKQKITGNCE